MYEAHFGLKSRPFGAKAEGSAVFVGPQQAKTMSSLKKGLVAADAVVTVTGPVGVGKTTIVSRALDSISPNRMLAWIGRMQLAPDEVVVLLLAGFGIQAQGKGTIQRFAAFRRLLNERTRAGVPVAIVVEDAQRLGVDALVEIEALTAGDNGDASSASIILMGQAGLHQLLSRPELARMKQRNRLRQAVGSLGQPEVTGYLRHCIREAGGDYDRIFGPGVAEVVHACSEGIPRMINTLCESALTTAAENGANQVTAALIHQVASETFGYEGPLPAVDTHVPPVAAAAPPETRADTGETAAPAAPTEQPKTPPAKEPGGGVQPGTATVKAAPPAPGSVAMDQPTEHGQPLPSLRDIVVESGRYPETPDTAQEPAAVTQPAAAAASEPRIAIATDDDNDDFVIPELINDTQPELSVLRPPVEEPPATKPAPRSSSPAREAKPAGPSAGDHNNAAPHRKAAQPTDSDEDDADFDLDAALAIDIEETNVMKGITHNLDSVAGNDQPQTRKTAGNGKGTAAAADLPTLSDSMRVHIDKPARPAKTKPAVPAPKVEPDKPPKASLSAATPPGARDRTPVTKPAPAAAAGELTTRIAAIDATGRGGDVEALEAALDAARKGNPGQLMTSPAPAPRPRNGAAARTRAAESPPSKQELVPEITLDKALESRRKPSREELEDIGKARALEEFSDAMAETLFGNEEFNQIAAEVVANPPPSEDQAAESAPVHEYAEPPPSGPSPVQLDDSIIMATTGAGFKPAVQGPNAGNGELRQSQAQRMDMLKAMKDGAPDRPAENIELGRDSPAPKTASRGPQPESIEDQFEVSLTQTLKSLALPEAAGPPKEVEEDKGKKSGGLFSRFRRSS